MAKSIEVFDPRKSGVTVVGEDVGEENLPPPQYTVENVRAFRQVFQLGVDWRIGLGGWEGNFGIVDATWPVGDGKEKASLRVGIVSFSAFRDSRLGIFAGVSLKSYGVHVDKADLAIQVGEILLGYPEGAPPDKPTGISNLTAEFHRARLGVGLDFKLGGVSFGTTLFDFSDPNGPNIKVGAFNLTLLPALEMGGFIGADISAGRVSADGVNGRVQIGNDLVII